MLTSEQVVKIYADHSGDFFVTLKEVPNRILEGMTLFASRGAVKDIYYSAEHDILHGPGLSDAPDLTEEDVIKLNRLGWHFEEEFECFAKFT